MDTPIGEQARPKIGERHAATACCLFQNSVRVAGSTADDIITPCLAVRDFDATNAKSIITIIKYR